MRVLVHVPGKKMKGKIQALVEAKKHGLAFNMLLSQAQVREYLPPGKNPSNTPDLILQERLRS